MPDGSGLPAWWVGLLIIIIIGGVVSFVVRASVLSKGGLNPFTAKEQLEAKLAQELDRRNAVRPPPPPPPRPSLEQRLAELDDLHRHGVISDQERQDAGPRSSQTAPELTGLHGAASARPAPGQAAAPLPP